MPHWRLTLSISATTLLLACGGPTTPSPPTPSAHTRPADTSPSKTPVAVADRTPPAAQALPPGALLPSQLHRVGTKHLDTDVQVLGYVVHIYDCAAAYAAKNPEKSPAEVKKHLAEHPEECLRPHFRIADTVDAPKDAQLWVVEVPRPLRPDEKKYLTEDQIAAHPKTPTFALGDRVLVSGTWALRSPRGFANSDGLLIYRSLRAAPK